MLVKFTYSPYVSDEATAYSIPQTAAAAAEVAVSSSNAVVRWHDGCPLAAAPIGSAYAYVSASAAATHH